MKSTFVDKGIPVIIGEYGCPKKNKEEASVRKFISSVCKEAYTRNMCPVLWDITDLHYDRTNCVMHDSEMLEAMMSVKPSETPTNPTEPPVPEKIMGDVNTDGEFTVADIVVLSGWLLAEEKNLNNWEAADFCDDDVIDVYDLCLARYQLVKISSR